MKVLILLPNVRDKEEISKKSRALTMDKKGKYTNTSPLDAHLATNYIQIY